MANKQTMPGINVPQRRNLVSGSIRSAGFRNVYQMPDISRPLQNAAAAAKIYYAGEKEAAFKRLDLLASRKQLEELESIRVADSNEKVPEIENNFIQNLNDEFSSDDWGKKWLEERGELFFAANSRDVLRAGIAKQKELYTLQMDKTLDTFAGDIATSAEDKARVLIGDAEKFIDDSNLLSPEEKQKSKDNFMDLTVQRMIGSNPVVALRMLDDSSYKWGEKGVDIEKYKQNALASMKNAEQKRLIDQINKNREIASDLITKSQTERLSLDDINKKVPKNSFSLRDFLYQINGYTKSDVGSGGKKITDTDKAIDEMRLYSELAGLMSNKNTKIEDWRDFEQNVYAAMNNKTVSKASGLKMLDQFATPYMKQWQNKLENAGIDNWRDPDRGYYALNNWIEEEVLLSEIKKTDYNNKSVYNKLTAGRDKLKSALYKMYNDALLDVVKETQLESVAAIQQLPEAKQNKIYDEAVDRVQTQWNQQRFNILKNKKPEQQPNSVLVAGGLVSNNNNINNSQLGIPVKNTGSVNIGKYQVRIKE